MPGFIAFAGGWFLGNAETATPKPAGPGYNFPRNEIFKSLFFENPFPSPKFDFFTNSIYNIIKVKLYIKEYSNDWKPLKSKLADISP